MIKPNGTIRYYHADALGSIIALTDESGAIKTQYSYSPFGLTKEIGAPSGNPFKFTGRELDETGLYYYRNRYLDPVMGTFISEDPIRFAGGDVNFYAYVRNRPLNLVDPLGLFGMFGPGLVNVRWPNDPQTAYKPSNLDGPTPPGYELERRSVIPGQFAAAAIYTAAATPYRIAYPINPSFDLDVASFSEFYDVVSMSPEVNQAASSNPVTAGVKLIIDLGLLCVNISDTACAQIAQKAPLGAKGCHPGNK